MIKKKSNKQLITSLVLIISGLIIGLCVLSPIIHRERLALLRSGKETVGIVTRAYIAGAWNTDCFTLCYSFIIDDTILDGITSYDLGGRDLFNKAVIGDTYRVRYNPDKPKKKSRIYIDEPVTASEEEYKRLIKGYFIMQEQIKKSKTWWKNF